MAKHDSSFACTNCGAVYKKWQGRCDDCGAWNSIAEDSNSTQTHNQIKIPKKEIEFTSLNADIVEKQRIKSGIDEFDRVCGDGMVEDSAILLGGDPGIGKSTLLLQIIAKIAANGINCLYISGEESASQIQNRAARLGIANAPIDLIIESELSSVLAAIKQRKPKIAIIDSIQTIWNQNIPSAPGTVSQVRTCAHELVKYGKQHTLIVILVGHITKDGQIAGPRVVEHLVDAVLQFEGERNHHFRILRGLKNRFGATDEIGVFEMASEGLIEVKNPSSLFIDERAKGKSGSVVFAGIEGTRPILLEIQALAARTAFGSPRRATIGWDSNRLAMIIAVLETRLGISFASHDIYLNVAGGMKITEPAADMAVAAALISALADKPLPEDCVIFGEIALSGDCRSVPRREIRLKEAEKLGMKLAIIPNSQSKTNGKTKTEINTKTVHNLGELCGFSGIDLG